MKSTCANGSGWPSSVTTPPAATTGGRRGAHPPAAKSRDNNSARNKRGFIGIGGPGYTRADDLPYGRATTSPPARVERACKSGSWEFDVSARKRTEPSPNAKLAPPALL